MPLRRNGCGRDAQAGDANVRRDRQRRAMFAKTVGRQTSSPRGTPASAAANYPGG
jgi:hypothetical protein